MNVTAENLETKVSTLNKWLQNNPETHHMYQSQIQKRNYYVGKLCTMSDSGLETIKI
ncbi:hypothetical protein PL373_06095 [Tenacibaculum maritimum]|nr:hypothetical protein [Tenacibaculum maritimum]MDB0600722.1 hypothetical protein [Tenacibaculum maritimum]MDB0612705.1 hypothetical protein [Tenacibaculum maritimum]